MEWLRTFIYSLPGVIGELVRRWYALKYFKRCGIKLKQYPNSRVLYPQYLSVGNRVTLADYILINAEGVVELGDNVVLGPYVNVQSVDLNRKVYGNFHGRLRQENSVIIEADVWVGMGASILPGTRIGRGAIIGAGAVLAEKTVAPYSIIVGNPGKVIGNRGKIENDG